MRVKYNVSILVGVLLLTAGSGAQAAKNYFEVGFARYVADYAEYDADVSAANFRYGTYFSKYFFFEGVFGFGGGDGKNLFSLGPTSNANILGRDSSFQSMEMKLKLQSNTGVYLGTMYPMGRLDVSAKLGIVYVAYDQTIHATTATIGGRTESRYSEEVGGDVLGLSLGLGINYFLTQQTSVSFEFIKIPNVRDRLIWYSEDQLSDGSTSSVEHTSFSDVRSHILNLGLRMHF